METNRESVIEAARLEWRERFCGRTGSPHERDWIDAALAGHGLDFLTVEERADRRIGATINVPTFNRQTKTWEPLKAACLIGPWSA